MNLTPSQLNKLKSDYAYRLVDNMDMDTLIMVAVETIENNIKDYEYEDLKEEMIDYYGEEEFNELISTINPYTEENPEAVTDYGVGK